MTPVVIILAGLALLWFFGVLLRLSASLHGGLSRLSWRAWWRMKREAYRWDHGGREAAQRAAADAQARAFWASPEGQAARRAIMHGLVDRDVQ